MKILTNEQKWRLLMRLLIAIARLLSNQHRDPAGMLRAEIDNVAAALELPGD